MKKILIVDDHTIVRQGITRLLRELLEPPPDFDEASSGPQAIDMVSNHDYSLVLLDISLPGRDGLDVLRQLRQINPKIPVIILSMHPDEQYAVRAFQAGAAGYVTKGCASDELQGAIEKVLRGGRYVNAFQAELLAEAVGEEQENAPLHKLLSDREYQFVSMMVSGMTMTEIARELSLSTKTISTYRTRVLEKLHLRTNADIISYWITSNLSK
ncbi:MAG: response regulator transcription factor [Desulfuromonadaceae bacterium]|nr:response regulator transcription factor [Desulfuromonadaceae bacterium]